MMPKVMAMVSQSTARNMGATLVGSGGVVVLAALSDGDGDPALAGFVEPAGAAAFPGVLGFLDGVGVGFSIIQLQFVRFVVVKWILDRRTLAFVQPKVTVAKRFCSVWPVPEAKAALS